MDIIVLELILVAVVALGLGFWQLYDVNRELRKDREAGRDEGQRTGADSSHEPVEDSDSTQGK